MALVLVVALSSSAPPVACQAASAEDGGPSPPERGTLPVEVPSEKIVVTGRRIDETTARAPTTSVTVIDTSEKSEELQTVTEALAETVGVQVRRFGGLGAFSTISIRGSTSNQVRFYLDGVPLSRARNETVNVADLPLDSLARIEVYRGTIPVGFGAGGIAGVVNLVSRPPAPEPQTEFGAAYGSFVTRKVAASHSRAAHGVNLLGYLTYLGSEGNFTFFDDNNTPFQPADDHTSTRRNNAFNSFDALLKGAHQLGSGLQLDLTSETFFKDQGVPGPGSPQALDASLSDLRSLNYLRVTRSALLDGALDLSATVFGIYERAAFSDRKGELGLGNVDRVDADSVVGGNTTGTYYALPTHAVSWFAEILHDRFAGSNRLADDPHEPDQTRLDLTLALQHQAAFFDERLLLVPTLRYEHVRDRVSASFDLANQPSGPIETRGHDLWSPSAGAQIEVQPWLLLRGNLGRFQRAPNFSELFGTRGIDRGNPDLHDETGTNRDVGFVATAPRTAWLDQARLEYAYFNNDYDDLIVFVNTGVRDVRPLNIGAARVRGHEVAFAATALHHLQVGGNYTHQDAEDRGDRPETQGKELPGRPADELYTRIEGFTDLVSLYYEFNYIGSNFLVRSNFLEAPSRDIHTLGLTVRPRPWLSLNFEVRNLTDDQIRDIANYPLPGRSFFGTVRVKL